MYNGLEGKEQSIKQLDRLFDMNILRDRGEAYIYFNRRVVCYMKLPNNDMEESIEIVRSVIKAYKKALMKN